MSFINLKWHGQWISDSVVRGYIANSKPLRDKCLHCLMPKELRDKDVGGQLRASTKTLVHKDTELEECINLANPPLVTEEKEETSLILIGLSQLYDRDLATFNATPAVSTTNQGTIATFPTNNELSALAGNPSFTEQFLNTMKASGNTFMNCTFNFK